MRKWDKYVKRNDTGHIIGIVDGAPELAKDAYNRAIDYNKWLLEKTANDLKKMVDAGFEHYQFVATLDEVTCPICGSLDGNVFKIADAAVGVNSPPMHIGCRCVTTIVFTDEKLANSNRFARDRDGRGIKVRADVFYPQYKQKYIDNPE